MYECIRDDRRFYNRAFGGIFFMAWRTPKSARTSSAPARTVHVLVRDRVNDKGQSISLASNPDVRWYYQEVDGELFSFLALMAVFRLTFSISLPIPVVVNALPPKTWVESATVKRYVRIYPRNKSSNPSPSAVSRPARETNLRKDELDCHGQKKYCLLFQQPNWTGQFAGHFVICHLESGWEQDNHQTAVTAVHCSFRTLLPRAKSGKLPLWKSCSPI